MSCENAKVKLFEKKFLKSIYLHTLWKICFKNFLEDFSKKSSFKNILEKENLFCVVLSDFYFSF